MAQWKDFLTGQFACPVIRINSAKELKVLQDLAKKNHLAYWEHFNKQGYKEIIHILKLNYCRLNNVDEYSGAFYRQNVSNGEKSFLVEYSAYKGFTFACLNEYDMARRDETEWEIIPMQKIIQELNIN
jgi:hypothetical protein